MSYYNAQGEARRHYDAVNAYYTAHIPAYEPEPRHLIVWAQVAGFTCRYSDTVWPGEPPTVPTFTRYGAVETISDNNVTMQMREGGVAPAFRPARVYQEVA